MSEKKVMGFGTFDALHPGHLFYLKQLRSLGDELIVVIARDSSVERIKGKAPHFDERARLKAVQAAGIADIVVLGNEDDFFRVVREHDPDVLGFGYDQRVDTEEIRRHFPRAEVLRIAPHKPERFKSSIIKQQLFG